MKIIPFILFIFLSLNCNIKNDLHSQSNNQYIEIYYFEGNILLPIQLHCKALQSEMFKEKVKYKKVMDSIYMQRFVKEYHNLKSEKEQRDIDVRIQVIFHSDKSIDTICMGNYFDVKVNGINKKNSKPFLDLIKEKMYESEK